MTTQLTEHDAGCWVDGSRGIYMPGRIVEIAMEYGFNPNSDNFCIEDWSLEGGPFNDDEKPSLSDYEWAYDLVDQAEDYMNQFAPDGYLFGFHPDWGDWGLYELGPEED